VYDTIITNELKKRVEFLLNELKKRVEFLFVFNENTKALKKNAIKNPHIENAERENKPKKSVKNIHNPKII